MVSKFSAKSPQFIFASANNDAPNLTSFSIFTNVNKDANMLSFSTIFPKAKFTLKKYLFFDLKRQNFIDSFANRKTAF